MRAVRINCCLSKSALVNYYRPALGEEGVSFRNYFKRSIMDVNWEDQKKINEYSKLSTRATTLESDIKKLRDQKDDYEELELELELADEEDEFPFHVGDSFMLLRKVEILERIEIESIDISVKIEELEAKQTLGSDRMEVLKNELYAKFGKENINLERD